MAVQGHLEYPIREQASGEGGIIAKATMSQGTPNLTNLKRYMQIMQLRLWKRLLAAFAYASACPTMARKVKVGWAVPATAPHRTRVEMGWAAPASAPPLLNMNMGWAVPASAPCVRFHICNDDNPQRTLVRNNDCEL